MQAWKPFPSSYGYAIKQLGLPADKVVMVASHPWDIAGAMQVRHIRGMQGGWKVRGVVRSICSALSCTKLKLPSMQCNAPCTYLCWQLGTCGWMLCCGTSFDTFNVVKPYYYALQAGLRGVYVRRNPHEAWPDYLPAPDGVVDDFDGLVELLGLS